MAKRNTIQKTLVYETVQSMANHPTAPEVYHTVAATCPSISKATVYRNLNLLADEGMIRRIEIANAPDRYDYRTTPHAHFKCINCGRVFDYHFSPEIKASEEENPDFTVLDYDLIFRGRCKDCLPDIRL